MTKKIRRTYTFWIEPDNFFTEKEQEEQCCEILSPPPDPCTDEGKVEIWHGFGQDEMEPSKEVLNAKYRAIYGDKFNEVKVIDIGPDPCGNKITEWSTDKTCCEDIDELSWSETEDSLTWFETYVFTVNGGELPLTWEIVSGKGLSVVKIGDREGKIFVTDCFCLPGVIKVSDVCGQVITKKVTSNDGVWEPIDISEVPYDFPLTENAENTGSGYVYQDDEYRVVQSWQWTTSWNPDPEDWDAFEFPGWDSFVKVIPDYQSWTSCGLVSPPVRAWAPIPYLWSPPYVYLHCASGYLGSGALQARGGFASDPASASKWKCDEYTELLYDETNSPDFIGAQSSGKIFWTGGRPPFQFRISGEGAYVDVDKTTKEKITTSQYATIYTDESCGVINVDIIDYCNDSVGDVIKSEGEWVLEKTVEVDQCDFFTELGLFDCTSSLLGYSSDILCDFDEYWVSNEDNIPGEQTRVSYTRTAGACGMKGGLEDQDTIIDYYDPDYYGVALPLLISYGDGSCYGTGEPTGSYRVYHRATKDFQIWKWSC